MPFLRNWVLRRPVVSSFFASSLAGSALAPFAACAEAPEASEAPEAPQESTGSTQSAIIGGAKDADPIFDAVGAVVAADPSDAGTQYGMICTASLIGPKVGLTARHCIDDLRNWGAPIFFSIGADIQHPRGRIAVVDTAVAPFEDAGWPNGFGTDVGVVYLADDVTSVTNLGSVRPIRIGRLENRDVGTRFLAVGYGIQDDGDDGTREVGPVTLRARSGHVFELYFGGFAAYDAWADANPEWLKHGWSGPASGSAWDQYVRRTYDDTTLVPDDQAFAGGAPGDAQPCHGDSGGPLVRESGGELIAYGVVSGGIGSHASLCGYGVVYSTFGPRTWDFLRGVAPQSPVEAESQSTGLAEAPATAPIAWSPCPTPDGVPLECATISVPLDYGDPRGEQIQVYFNRLASHAPDKRLGVLLLNPGGPGGLGSALTPIFAKIAPRRLLDAYDLIGFDPRFMGGSTPLRCHVTNAELAELRSWPKPSDEPADAVIAAQIARQCLDHFGHYQPFFTTANTARDMEQIRKALGEDHVAFYGGSYGSYLGAVFATLFPRKEDRILLDSNVNPDWVWHEMEVEQAEGAQLRFSDFTAYLAANDATYHLGATGPEVARAYDDVTKQLDGAPVTLPAGAPPLLQPGAFLDGDGLRHLAVDAMISDALFPGVGKVLQTVRQGGLPAGTPPDPDAEIDAMQDNLQAGYLGIVCADAAWPRSVASYASDVALYSTLYPFEGANVAKIEPCSFFPDPVQPRVTITSDGPPSILLLQSNRDPETTYAGALRLRALLGSRATMVTVDQGAHAVYLFQGNACVNDYGTSFLVDGTRPSKDVECARAPVIMPAGALPSTPPAAPSHETPPRKHVVPAGAPGQ